MTEPIDTAEMRRMTDIANPVYSTANYAYTKGHAIADEIDSLRQQLTDANKRMDEIMQEYAAIKFKGVGEQHVYPVPRKRAVVREGD